MMLNEIKALGCEDDTKIMMAYQTYLEIAKIDHLNVSCHYHAGLDLIFLVAKKNDSTSVYVPVHSSFTLSSSWIFEVQNELSGLHKDILLVIRDGDSSSILYKLTQGLVPPSTTQSKRFKSEKSGDRTKTK